MIEKSSKTVAKLSIQENNGQQNFAYAKPAKRWTFIILAFGLINGCGAAPSQQALSAQVISKMQAQKANQELQQQLILHAPQSSLSSYRDYQIGPEDLIEISFFGNDDLGREVRVNGRGEISLPLVGVVQVAGLSPQELEGKLVKIYREDRFIRHPQITAMVKEYRHQRVMVTGAVVTPGSYEVIGPRTLLEMLGKAGGLVDKSEMKAGNLVYIIRNQNAPSLLKAAKRSSDQKASPGTVAIDLRRLLSGTDLNLNLPIANGDVIYVPPAKMAFVLGAVKKPGQVAVRDDLTVTQAIALTEGLDLVLSSNRIDILRFDDKGERIIMSVNLKAITSGQESDPLLKENDIIFVQESGFRRFWFDFRNMLPGSVGLGASLPII